MFVGVAGAAGVSLTAALWVLAARRAVEERLVAVLARLEPGRVPACDPAQDGACRALVATPAMAYYHLADCPLAVGKPVSQAGQAAHVSAGRRPCGVCRP